MITAVVLSSRVRKELRKCPAHIVRKLMGWVGNVYTLKADGSVEFALVETVNKHRY